MIHPSVETILQTLLRRHPGLSVCEAQIKESYHLLKACFDGGHRLYLCGNGGSAADCEHIAGELLKGFMLPRKLPQDQQLALAKAGDEEGFLAARLQSGLPCTSLASHTPLTLAVINDIHAELTFAQQAYALMRQGDVLLGITTSGNAANVRYAAVAARARGAKVIGLTGQGGGKLKAFCDGCIMVPENETYKVQELHLPVYHALCAMLEMTYFGEVQP